jgi:3-methyladenine DNA glycosylase/8-oxoguanine DNA glycosylase
MSDTSDAFSESSAATSAAAVRRWRPGRPLSLGATVGILRHGAGDPAYQRDPDGTIWRACRTPDGPVTLRLSTSGTPDEVEAQAWGPGAGWTLDGLPQLLGADDDATGFEPRHDLVRQLARRFPGWRVPRSGLVLESLAAAAIEQVVTGQEAFRGWRLILLRHGEPAPGPAAGRGMRVPPTAKGWASIPSWEWLQAGIDPRRSKVVVRAAGVAGRLEATVGLPGPEAERILRGIPGVGVWTAAEVRQRAHGDADAVSFGDYHVAKNIGVALLGEEIDDDGLAELLEPYRPHRYRVQRLLELGGAQRPRHGPRMAPRTHLPTRR